MTITQSVTIEAASGVTAFIHPPIGDAITINAGASDTVILRSLTLNGGASRGIVVGSAGILQIENCTITGFHDSAIAFNSGGALLLADSLISGNGMNAAVLLSPPGTAPASLTAERCRIQDNWAGIQFLIGTTGTIRDCVITGSHGSAITSANLGSALTATDVTLENCVISRNALDSTSSRAPLRSSNCVITNNTTGLFVTGGAQLLSRGNNTLEGNATPGAFTSTYSAH